MKIDLTGEELSVIKESLKYSKIKIEAIPIGIEGYPSYEIKREKLNGIEGVIEKLRTSV